MLPLISIRTPLFPTTELRPALFIDRDDTLMPDKPYLAARKNLRISSAVVQAASLS